MNLNRLLHLLIPIWNDIINASYLHLIIIIDILLTHINRLNLNRYLKEWNMNIIKRLIGVVSKNSQITHTKPINIFTKYGMYKAKMYTNNEQEYLALMSLNFFEVQEPILYIHSDTHQCSPMDDHCGCNNKVDMILTTISQVGGLLIYTSKNRGDIDKLLNELNTRALESQEAMMLGTNYKSAFKGYRGEYIALDFILKDLRFSKLQLISDNPHIIFIIEQRGIEITKQTPFISHTYGETIATTAYATIEAAKAIPFAYNNAQ